jgi:hypothetical protein
MPHAGFRAERFSRHRDREHEILGQFENLFLGHEAWSSLGPGAGGRRLHMRLRSLIAAHIDRRRWHIVGDDPADGRQDLFDRGFGGLLWLAHQHLRRVRAAPPSSHPGTAFAIVTGNSGKHEGRPWTFSRSAQPVVHYAVTRLPHSTCRRSCPPPLQYRPPHLIFSAGRRDRQACADPAPARMP